MQSEPGKTRRRPAWRIEIVRVCVLLLLLSFGTTAAQTFTHAPIFIDGNGGFTAANGISSGSGSASDPFVIDAITINATNAENGIVLRGTTSSVTIRNCEVKNAQLAGINLFQAANVTIEGCTLSDNERGINVVDSRNVTLNGNRAVFNRMIGIGTFNSKGVELTGNLVAYNWEQRLDALESWGVFTDPASTTKGRDMRLVGNLWNLTILAPTAEGEELINSFEALAFKSETSCTQVFNEFLLFVGRSDDAPPLSEPYCAELLSILRSLPDHMRGRINQFLFLPADEQFAGLFTGVGTVRLLDIKNVKEFVEITFHEIGHVLQDRLFQDKQVTQWQSLHQRSGRDPDHYAQVPGDRVPREQATFESYGMTNDWEDFATVFEAYTRDTIAMIERAQAIKVATDKTVLLQKIAFVAGLFQTTPFIYRQLADWDSAEGMVDVRLQRAPVRLQDGLPVIESNPKWESF